MGNKKFPEIKPGKKHKKIERILNCQQEKKQQIFVSNHVLYLQFLFTYLKKFKKKKKLKLVVIRLYFIFNEKTGSFSTIRSKSKTKKKKVIVYENKFRNV